MCTILTERVLLKKKRKVNCEVNCVNSRRRDEVTLIDWKMKVRRKTWKMTATIRKFVSFISYYKTGTIEQTKVTDVVYKTGFFYWEQSTKANLRLVKTGVQLAERHLFCICKYYCYIFFFILFLTHTDTTFYFVLLLRTSFRISNFVFCVKCHFKRTLGHSRTIYVLLKIFNNLAVFLCLPLKLRNVTVTDGPFSYLFECLDVLGQQRVNVTNWQQSKFYFGGQ